MSKQDRNEGKSGISDLTVIALVTSILVPPVGWVTGFRARKQIVESDGKYVGRPFAVAAIWIGGIITTAWLLFAILMGVSTSMSHDDGGFGGFGGGHRAHMGQGWAGYAPQGQRGNQGFDQGGFGGAMGQPQDPNSSTNP